MRDVTKSKHHISGLLCGLIVLLTVVLCSLAQTTNRPPPPPRPQIGHYYSMAHPERSPMVVPPSPSLTITPRPGGGFYFDDRNYVYPERTVTTNQAPVETPRPPAAPMTELQTNAILAHWELLGPRMYKTIQGDIELYRSQGNAHALSNALNDLKILKSIDPTNAAAHN